MKQKTNCTVIETKDRGEAFSLRGKLRDWARVQRTNDIVTRLDGSRLFVSDGIPRDVIDRAIGNYRGVRVVYAS